MIPNFLIVLPEIKCFVICSQNTIGQFSQTAMKTKKWYPYFLVFDIIGLLQSGIGHVFVSFNLKQNFHDVAPINYLIILVIPIDSRDIKECQYFEHIVL